MAIARVSVLTGHVVGSLIQTLIAIAVVLGVALRLGFSPTAGPLEWVAAIGLLTMVTYAVIWLAVALGLVSKSVESASNLPMPLILLPFLGSGFVPTDSMPTAMRWFAEYQPFTPIMETLRGLLMGTPIGSSGVLAVAWSVVVGLALVPVGQAAVQPRPDADLIASAPRCAPASSESASATRDAGPLDAITDVAGVRVGSVTLIEGEDVRTGVTVIVPSEADVGAEQLFAGCHTLNGNGELTGLEWVRESGRLTHADRDHQHPQRRRRARRAGRALGARSAARTTASTGRCRSSARPRTGCSTTSTASTCGRSTSTRRSRRRAAGRSRRARSAAARG